MQRNKGILNVGISNPEMVKQKEDSPVEKILQRVGEITEFTIKVRSNVENKVDRIVGAEPTDKMADGAMPNPGYITAEVLRLLSIIEENLTNINRSVSRL